MRLLLFHPGVASIDCEDCRRHIYDLETGQRKTFRVGPARKELPQVRPANVPPPCERCPRESPEKSRSHVLNRRNIRAVRCYLECRAAGVPTEWQTDRVLRRNLAIIDGVYREWERHAEANEIRGGVAQWLTAKLTR